MADSEESEGPPERDVKDFSFRQMRKIRMFESPDNLPTSRCSLLAVSSKYGFTFVGCPNGIKVIRTDVIRKINDSDEGSMQNVVEKCPSTLVRLHHSVQFVGLSCDELILSALYENENGITAVLFDVPTLGNKIINPSDAKFAEVSISTDAGFGNFLWNTGYPGMFAMCLGKGSVSVMAVTGSEVKPLACLPASVQASAICWSPKGKQLVVGHKDGRLTQYSQTLEVKKEIACPDVFNETHSVTDLLWITPTFFAAVYSNVEEGDIPKFLLISAPKNEPTSVINFEDIHFVMSEERQPMFYLKFISAWNLLISACSNGFEAAVVGKYGGEAPWEKWNFEDTGRAEMPLTSNNDETFPMGIAIDLTSTKSITEGEKQLPPAPIMMLLSTDGTLCPFYMVNQTPNAPHDIVKAAEPLPPGGTKRAILSTVAQNTQQSSVPGTTGTFSFTSSTQIGSSTTSAAPVSTGLGVTPLGASGTVGSLSFSNNVSSTFGSLSTQNPSLVLSKTGVIPFGSSQAAYPQSQAPSLESWKAKASTQLVKPTPIVQTQPTVSRAQPPAQSQGFSLGDDPPQGISTQPPLVGHHGAMVQPKPTTEKATSSQPAALHSDIGSTPAESSSRETAATEPSQGFSFPGAPDNTTQISKQDTTSKGFSLGDDPPEKISSVPPVVRQQGVMMQPGPTAEKPTSSKPDALQSNNGSTLLGSSSREPAIKEPSQGLHLPEALDNTTQISKQDTTTKGFSLGDNPPEETSSVPRLGMQSSKENRLEATVSENIQKEVKEFEKELASLREHVQSMRKNCRLVDDDRELPSFRKTTEHLCRSFKEIKDSTKEQQKDIEEEKRKLLETFEMMDNARIRQNRRGDPQYVQLLMSRPLDPVNASNMKEIRKYHLYLEKTLREVNSMLDEQWNKENDAKRFIQRPALNEVYKTLRTNQRIAQNQAAMLERITGEMKSRKLLVTSWQGGSKHTLHSRNGELSTLTNPLLVPEGGAMSPPSPNIPAPVSPQKQAQLKSILQKRRTTPVRRSKMAPCAIVKSPLAESSRNDLSFLSSTPVTQKNGLVLEKDLEGDALNLDVSAAASPFQLRTSTVTTVTKPATVPQGSKGSFSLGDYSEKTNENAVKCQSPHFTATPNRNPATVLEGPKGDYDNEGNASSLGNSATVKGLSQNTDSPKEKDVIQTHASTETTGHMLKQSGLERTQSESVSQPLSTTTFSAFEVKGTRSASELSLTNTKPQGTQKTVSGIQAPSPRVSFSSGAFLPPTRTQASEIDQVSSVSDSVTSVKTITKETPPSIAAAMAAMTRASAAKGSVQTSSNLDLSASIEPATLVAYRPQSTQEVQAKDYDAGNVAAKAIANAALQAATAQAQAQAQKPAGKPQSSTEFTFKSADSSKSGPPVATFKPALSHPHQSEDNSKSFAAPIITVKPPSVFKPTVLSAVTTAAPSSSSSSTPGLVFKGPLAGSPFSQVSASSTPLGFSTTTGPFFTFGASSLVSTPGTATFTFGGQTTAVPTAVRTVTSTPSANVTSNPGVNRTLFSAASLGLQTKSTMNPSTPVGEIHVREDNRLLLAGHDQEQSQKFILPGVKEDVSSSLESSKVPGTTSSTTGSVTTTIPVTSFTFGTAVTSGGGICTTLGPSTNVIASNKQVSSSDSILSALMRSSDGSNTTGSLFAAVPPTVPSAVPSAESKATESTANTSGVPLPPTSLVATLENSKSSVVTADTPAVNTSSGTGGLFAPVPASVGSPLSTIVLGGSSAGITVKTGSPTTVSSPLPSAGIQGKNFAPATTTVTRNIFSSVTTDSGNSLPAFSAKTSATMLLSPTALSVTTTVSPAVGVSLFGTPALSTAATVPKSSSENVPSAPPSGLFGQFTTTASAFGAVPAATSTGSGFLGTVTTTATVPSLFGAAVSTTSPFATTSVFGSTGMSTFGGVPKFGSSVSTPGNTFGSPPVFGSLASTSSTGSLFGTTTSVAKPSFGQSSFSSPTTGSSTLFGQVTSKAPETGLGFGFSGFGIGGQSSSEPNKNPFGTAQGFTAVSTENSLFGSKSGAGIFKPSFGGGSFTGFGTQSSGGFSSGTFSGKDGSVAAAGFGFSTASSATGSSGFGSAPSFGSTPTAGSVFGGAPAFGSSPSFGGGSSFGGSPQRGLVASPAGGVFGSVSPSGFGQSASGSPTFGSLASQSNLPTFGSLAGHSQPQAFGSTQQQQGMSFSSFGSSGTQSVGSSSFQQWR